MTKGGWVLTGMAVLLIVLATSAAALVWHPEISPVTPSPLARFDRALVKQGEALAELGNCAGCHTAADGKAYAGGRGLATPFGTVFSSNITPATESGIGTWPLEAFRRALREGLSRDGHHLYPAFPYDHFTKASDSEINALYAFLMTRPAAEATPPPNKLEWPYGERWLVAFWNLLYLRKGPDSDSDRGRVLVEGLAHCGGCHTPRNELGAEDKARAFDGAMSEGWYAPPLNGRSPAAQPWPADELFAYLRTGLARRHAAAAGPMASVTRALAQAPEDDVRAIAGYVARLMASAPAAASPRPAVDRRGTADAAQPLAAALFAGACAHCHEPGAPMMQLGRPPLSWSTSLRVDSPNDTLHVIMSGLHPPAGASGPEMPGYAADFNDREIAMMATYLRARFTELPSWPDVERTVGELRKEMPK